MDYVLLIIRPTKELSILVYKLRKKKNHFQATETTFDVEIGENPQLDSPFLKKELLQICRGGLVRNEEIALNTRHISSQNVASKVCIFCLHIVSFQCYYEEL